MKELAPEGAGPRGHSTGQGAYAQGKWVLLNIVEEIREPLRLKGTSIAILRAMLSFLREDIISPQRDASHICFASNAALARRAHVSIQTVERHVSKLVQLGLLTRRSSGNGKRWARRDVDGEIVLATGLSLLPLVKRHDEFVAMARTYAARQRELSLLRDKCAAALAQLRSIATDTNHLNELYVRARLLLRRKPDGEALSHLLDDINNEITAKQPTETKEMRDTDHQTEGHKETVLNPTVNKKKNPEIKVSQGQMQESFPRLCSELKFARDAQDCHQIMANLAQQLRLGTLWPQIQTLGPALSFMILGYLVQRIDGIKSPKAYARYLFKKMSGANPDWNSLMKLPERVKNSC